MTTGLAGGFSSCNENHQLSWWFKRGFYRWKVLRVAEGSLREGAVTEGD